MWDTILFCVLSLSLFYNFCKSHATYIFPIAKESLAQQTCNLSLQ